MSTQPEAVLEANLVKQLSEELSYEKVHITDEAHLMKWPIGLERSLLAALEA